MIPRTVKRFSSSSSASARAGIKSLLCGSESAEVSYQTKTFEDEPSNSPSPFASPSTSRRGSQSAGFGARRDSFKSGLLNSMTPLETSVAPAGARPFSASAANGYASAGSGEHGAYNFTPKELAAVKKRVEEEFLLKSVTRAPIRHRRPSSKVPYEFEEDGTGETLHPSGFVVPTPGDAPAELQADTRVRPAILNRGIPESVITFADLKELATAENTTRPGKVPQEVLGLNGTVEHPSGFIPPSPQHPDMEGVKEHYKPAVKLHQN